MPNLLDTNILKTHCANNFWVDFLIWWNWRTTSSSIVWPISFPASCDPPKVEDHSSLRLKGRWLIFGTDSPSNPVFFPFYNRVVVEQDQTNTWTVAPMNLSQHQQQQSLLDLPNAGSPSRSLSLSWLDTVVLCSVFLEEPVQFFFYGFSIPNIKPRCGIIIFL